MIAQACQLHRCDDVVQYNEKLNDNKKLKELNQKLKNLKKVTEKLNKKGDEYIKEESIDEITIYSKEIIDYFEKESVDEITIYAKESDYQIKDIEDINKRFEELNEKRINKNKKVDNQKVREEEQKRIKNN